MKQSAEAVGGIEAEMRKYAYDFKGSQSQCLALTLSKPGKYRNWARHPHISTMHCTGKGLLRRNSLIREKYEAFKLEPSARPHTFVRGNNQTNHIFSNNPNAFQVRQWYSFPSQLSKLNLLG